MPRGCPIKKIVDCVARKKNFHWIAMTRTAWGGNRWEQNSLWILRNIFLPFVRLIERYLTHSLNVINISEVRASGDCDFSNAGRGERLRYLSFFSVASWRSSEGRSSVIDQVVLKLWKRRSWRGRSMLDKCKYDVKKIYMRRWIDIRRFVSWFLTNYKKQNVFETYYFSLDISQLYKWSFSRLNMFHASKNYQRLHKNR